ncbi:MAG: hypothetical protein VZR64_09740, partial [Eubacterium sp.]|nr:hypothetical protein [Eubacterium sp.]
RGISGRYRWSDGTYKSYVGSYEKKFLEFCDVVLHLDSGDLLTPGPTIYYEYDGKEHTWITDAIYLPYNLVFDIKDGGDNKNNRDMPEYRSKQLAKEQVITDQGIYSYIRLTNNDFVQLLTIFAELKEAYMNDTEPKTISRIHEHTAVGAIGGIPSLDSENHNVFITNYMNKNTFETGFAISNDIATDTVVVRDKKTGKLKKADSKELLEDCEFTIYKYIGNDSEAILRELYETYKSGQYVDYQYLPCLVTEFQEVLTDDQLDFSTLLEEVDFDRIEENYNSIAATLQYQIEAVMSGKKPMVFDVLDPVKYEYKNNLLREYSDLTILQSLDGKYFAYNTISCKRTKGVDSIYGITENMLKSII